MSRKGRYGFVKPQLVALFSAVDAVGSGLTLLGRAARRPSLPTPPRRILLMNMAHIGDALMISPPLRAVRFAYPDAHISVLVGPWSKELLTANPYLDEILVFRPGWWDRDNGAYLRPAELRDLIRLLHEGRFDLSINFKSFFQENLALWLARIPSRVGYGIYGGGFLLTHHVDYDWHAHTVELNLALVERAAPGATSSADPVGAGRFPIPEGTVRLSRRQSSHSNQPEMFVFEEDIRVADEFLKAEMGHRAGAEDEPSPVTFHIGAGYPSKLWGAEKYAALANEIGSKWRARIVVVGGPDDLPLIAQMQRLSSEQLIVAAGRLSIRQTAALIARSQLFVGNDSGPAHIAASTGVPTVSIFSGENDAAVWRPYAENCAVLQRHPECSPCGKKTCDRDHICMEAISVEDVLDAAGRILEGVHSS